MAASGSRARPARDVPLGSFAELSCQKIVFDLQLANLPIQDIDLCLAGPALGRATAVKNTGRAVQQLLLPIVDLVRMNPELARQLGDRSVALDRSQAHLRLDSPVVLLPFPLHVLLPPYPTFLGSGPNLT